MHIDDLFSPDDLRAAIEAGHVRTQRHPTLPLMILNYTELCQFSRAWSPVTRTCRGLIVRETDGVVLARPLEKIHNHNEPDAPTIDLLESVLVTDKIDGSLGILYPVPDGFAIATRGSFTSDQAEHASHVWVERYEASMGPRFLRQILRRFTPLFEIVYPANRIVVDYGDMDDLVLLGGVDRHTGRYLHPGDMAELMNWTGPVAEMFAMGLFADVLAAPPRPGKEGYVVHSLDTGATVKVKQADYVELHKIVTGLNARTVWEALAAGRPLSSMLDGLPDEFHGWVVEVAEELSRQVNAIWNTVQAAYAAVWAQLGDPGRGKAGVLSIDRAERKRFAAVAAHHDLRAYLFLMLDGRYDKVKAMAWDAVRPAADWTPSGVAHGEDAA
jgi:RNA ligase